MFLFVRSLAAHLIVSVTLLLSTLPAGAATYDITKYGARADGITLCTTFIQQAINDCSRAGGGTVLVPTGTFCTGTVYLKNGVTLYLEKGAVLLGSRDTTDYPNNAPQTVKCLDTHGPHGGPMKNRALIYAEGQQGISIIGEGTINGNGDDAVWQRGDNGSNRPKLIFFISCKMVSVKDIYLRNSPFWMQEYLGCDGVIIEGIHVYNHANWNEDGLDIDSRNVIVRGCFIDSDDDGICLKSSLRDQPCENVTITNCVVASNCNAIKFGTPGFGGFKNVTITGCTVGPCLIDLLRHRERKNPAITAAPASESGIAIECVDGGQTDGVTIDNITIHSTLTPIFIKLGNRSARLLSDTGHYVASLRNVIISNIVSDGHSLWTSSITGYPGAYVENVQLHHLIFNLDGGGTPAQRNISTVKENEGGYPSPSMFGAALPAYAFFIRHVNGINIEDVSVNLAGDDARYAVVLDDVHFAHLRDISVHTNGRQASMLTPADIRTSTSDDAFLDDKKLP
jgi:polygalacturonase